MIELEVVGITARPISDEERQRRIERLEQALADKPPPLRGPVVVDIPTVESEVRLKERAGNRILDICIGEPEAHAIALGLHAQPLPRPMTHDFIGNLLRALDDVTVLRVVITKRERDTFHELGQRDRVVIPQGEPWTFHARLELQHHDRVLDVDCRPSDGIALAVRLGVPILAANELEPILAAA